MVIDFRKRKERNAIYNKTNICKVANGLAKQGYSKSEAFKKAWEFAKNVISKVSGVSFGKRPAAIKRLTHYKPEQISVSLEREKGNSFDRNAIAVIAAVEGKGAHCVGCVPSETAKLLAPVMDKGAAVRARLERIVGGGALR